MAVLTPLILMSAPAASATTSGSLTLTTLDRNGKAVTSSAQAVNVRTGSVYNLTSGKAHSLPKGSYDVIVVVNTDGNDSGTLGAKAVTVSGTTKVTVDARQGDPVKASLSPSAGSGYSQTLTTDLCVPNSAAPGFLTSGTPGSLYVIPSSVSGVELAYSSTWVPDEEGTGGGAGYLASARHTKGLPSGVSTTFHQSSLATVSLSARGGPETGAVSLQLNGDGGDECGWGTQVLSSDGTLPYTFTAHVPAGPTSITQIGQDVTYDLDHTYSAGKSYSLTLNHAAWGPGGQLPYTWGAGHRLYMNTAMMFSDSALPYAVGEKTAYKLTESGRTIESKTVTGFGQATVNPVIKTAGWYTLTASATRDPDPGRHLPSTALSTASTLSLHFYANPKTSDQARGYLTRFSPAGLNSDNQAKPGATTTVTLGMQRGKPNDDEVHQLTDTAEKVQAWASTDGGKTWRSVKVTHSGSTWTAAVPDPASGTVSLRSEVTDSHSDTSTTTVVNAYAVS